MRAATPATAGPTAPMKTAGKLPGQTTRCICRRLRPSRRHPSDTAGTVLRSTSDGSYPLSHADQVGDLPSWG